MRANFTYLYQIKSSKNYFFRIRSNIFNILCNYPQGRGHFVSSLKTPVLDEAAWLASFIRRKIMEDAKMHAQRLNNIQIKALAQLSHDISSIQLELELNRFLKESFNHWLNVGKEMTPYSWCCNKQKRLGKSGFENDIQNRTINDKSARGKKNSYMCVLINPV